MINVLENIFVLQTDNTMYCFEKIETGHLKHLYYGKSFKTANNEFAAMSDKTRYPAGNLISYSEEYKSLSLENVCLEISGMGKGDIREPLIVIRNKDGSYTSDFIYEGHKINNSDFCKPDNMPSAFNPDEQLVITVISRDRNIRLELIYNIFESVDCISRSVKLINNEDNPIYVERLLSNQLDIDSEDYIFVNFAGGWAREMNRQDSNCICGKLINSSNTGTSSNRNNPFTILKKSDTNEMQGECYGFNLVYSGNHYTCVEKNSFGKIRLVSGINPFNFGFAVESGDCLWSCEAVMTYSDKGLNRLSHNMHEFVRHHIVRGAWSNKARPVLLNSWEAAYFKFDEGKLLGMAKVAKQLGIELFVMDDGWFGKRDNDECSLGDWDYNPKKLPNGLSGLSKKIKDMGMMFGIWVEPEMISVDSDLYREHPDWAVQIPDMPHSEGRNQRILNLTKKEVRDFIVEKMSEVFGSGNVDYVKWDMNRIFSDTYADNIQDQKEFCHRYVLGLYEVLESLTERFPNILFEGCASGGNRFDLGMLCYMPQIWASDNTDAWCRAGIQTGLSYGYPMSVIAAHVSGCPNHQTLRNTLLETRFNVAMAGILGYECNISDLSESEKNEISNQIQIYKKYRDVLFNADFYRMKCNSDNGYGTKEYQWVIVSKDRNMAVAFQMQDKATPDYPDASIRLTGLDEEKIYHFYNIPAKYDIKYFGDLINTVAPFHVKQNSVVHRTIGKFVKMNGELEDYRLSGGMLNSCGVRLHKNYCGTGYDSDVRFYQDFASRLYYLEAVNV